MAKMPQDRAKARARKQEYQKANIRAKVEHPFRVIKPQFGPVKVRFKGLAAFAALFKKLPLARTVDDYEALQLWTIELGSA